MEGINPISIDKKHETWEVKQSWPLASEASLGNQSTPPARPHLRCLHSSLGNEK